MANNNVARAAEVLIDDYHRQGDRLLQHQVDRVLDKRNLSPEECLGVYELLGKQKIEITPDVEEKELENDSTPSDSSQSTKPPKDYLARLRATKLLKHEEVIQLARQVSLGLEATTSLEAGQVKSDGALQATIRRGKEAKQRLTVSNLRLVVSIARAYERMSDLELHDLVQEGTIGLMHAVDKFDHTKGFQFSTYATWWIRQSITRAIADKGTTVRFPVYVFTDIRKVRNARLVLRKIHGREPTVHQIARELEWEPEKVQFVSELGRASTISLDAPVDGDADRTIADSLISGAPSAADIFYEAEQAAAISVALDCLSAREREILIMRFGLGDIPELTLEAIGEQYKVTRERIRQIEAKALKHLRRQFDSLNPFLNSSENMSEN